MTCSPARRPLATPVRDRERCFSESGVRPSESSASEPPRRRELVADAAKVKVGEVEVVGSPATLVKDHLHGWTAPYGTGEPSAEEPEVSTEIGERADKLVERLDG